MGTRSVSSWNQGRKPSPLFLDHLTLIKPIDLHECFALGNFTSGLEVSLRHRESVTHPNNIASPIDP